MNNCWNFENAIGEMCAEQCFNYGPEKNIQAQTRELQTKVNSIATIASQSGSLHLKMSSAKFQFRFEKNGTNIVSKVPNEKHVFLEIPIRGLFGKDVFYDGVADALEFASNRDIPNIVFTIDSRGGSVIEARRIIAEIDKYGNQFNYIAVVKEGLGSALWVIVRCDSIYLMKASIVGGGVDLRSGLTPDDHTVPSVEAKSVYAAKVSAVADARGHDRSLVRAMIVKGAEVYVSQSPNSATVKIFSSAPDPVRYREIKHVDTKESVLTLTGSDAIAWGFAADFRGSGVMQKPRWESYSQFGKVAMQEARERHKKTKQVQQSAETQKKNDMRQVFAWSDEVKKMEKRAEQEDPRLYDDYQIRIYSTTYEVSHKTVTGTQLRQVLKTTKSELTMNSKRKWIERTNSAIDEWKSIRAGIVDIYKIMKKYEEEDFDRKLVTELMGIDRSAAKNIDRLLDEKNP